MKKLQQFAQDAAYFWAISCVFFTPFPFHIFPFQANISEFLWGRLIDLTAQKILHITIVTHDISSDSLRMYVLVLLLAMLAITGAGLGACLKVWTQKRIDILAAFRQMFYYYLALQMLKYGFDKVFKAQFYLPEPNTLYTPLGQLSKDIMFWSTMGTSYTYTVFGGVLEALAGACILFKRTRVLGLLMTIGIMLQVVAINFGFDISVKVYSLLLLFLSLILLAPQATRLYQFLILQQDSRLRVAPETFPTFFNRTARIVAQVFMIGIILLEALYPYIKSGNFNDDSWPRPYLHGAYQVVKASVNQRLVELHQAPIKRLFVHRQGFMIFQNFEDQMQDFRLDIRQGAQQILLTDYQLKQVTMHYHYQPKDSLLTLQYTWENQRIKLTAKALNWRKLPAIQKQFHWSIDEVK